MRMFFYAVSNWKPNCFIIKAIEIHQFCHWCKTSKVLEIMEDQHHVLFSYDLYRSDPSKQLKRINKSFEACDQLYQLHMASILLNKIRIFPITQTNPNTKISQTANNIEVTSNRILNHNHDQQAQHKTALKRRQSYVENCIATSIILGSCDQITFPQVCEQT